MRTLRTIVAGLVLTLPFLAETRVEAQTHAASAVPPPGSYQQSCTRITFEGGTHTLTAQCNKANGLPMVSQLVTTPCGTADISNTDGKLRCQTAATPAGPYRILCPDAWVYGTELRAYCRKTPYGPAVYSELAYGTCKGPITVIGAGHLACDQGIPIPQGSYRQSCEVAAYAWMGVIESLFMDCKKPDGNWNWNQISQPAKCFGDIWNEEGMPKCNRGGLPPAGSYTASCTKPWRLDDVLFATCRVSGNPLPVVTARLASISACNGADIFNESGVLKCIPAPPPPPPPARTITRPTKVVPGTLLPPPPPLKR